MSVIKDCMNVVKPRMEATLQEQKGYFNPVNETRRLASHPG